MEEISSIYTRIKELVDYFCEGNNSKFAALVGSSEANIRNYIAGRQPKFDFISSIAKNLEISYDWLLTGRGSMLKEETTPPMGEQVAMKDEGEKSEIQILHHPRVADKIIVQQTIPVYNIEAAANLKTVFSNKDQNILGEITMPDIPRCDGAVYVRGDSMYPLLKSGDIVGYKEILDFSNVIFGEMYIIAYDIEGDEYVCVKYVNHSEQTGYVKLVSYNTHHDPKDVPISRINAMALVKFSIRMNTMI